ncbi:hypothetical protein L195_g030103, partial [Trifolium pratense]
DIDAPHDSPIDMKSDITSKVVDPPIDAKPNIASKVMDPPVDARL